MAKKLTKTDILVVSATSGEGKSSVVKASLLPFIPGEEGAEPFILRRGDPIIADGAKLGQLPYSQKQLEAVAYSPEGAYIVCSDVKGEIQIWRNLFSTWDSSV